MQDGLPRQGDTTQKMESPLPGLDTAIRICQGNLAQRMVKSRALAPRAIEHVNDALEPEKEGEYPSIERRGFRMDYSRERRIDDVRQVKGIPCIRTLVAGIGSNQVDAQSLQNI